LIPTGGVYSAAPVTLLAVFKETTTKGERREGEDGGKGKERGAEERKGQAPKYFGLEPFLPVCLCVMLTYCSSLMAKRIELAFC